MRTLRVVAVVVAVLAFGTGLGAPAPVAAEPRATEAELTRFAFWFLWDTVGPEPTDAQVRAVVRRLQQGTSRGALAREATRSPQWAAKVVDDLYRRILGRPVDASGREYWSGRLRGGMPSRHMVVALFASPEYEAGWGELSLVRRLYEDVLWRFSTTVDEEYWTGRLQGGASRSSVASALYRTTESRRIRADRLYRELLERRAGPGEATYWAGRLVREDDLALVTHLLASAEYLTRAQARSRPVGPSTVATTTPDAYPDARSFAVSADGRVVVEVVGVDEDESTRIVATDLAAGTTETVLTHPDPPYGSPGFEGLDVSGDGDLVAVAIGGTVHLVDRSSGAVTEVGVTPGGGLVRAHPALSADGSTLAFASAAEDMTSQFVVVHDIATGDEVVVRGDETLNVDPDLSADGRYTVFTSMSVPFTFGGGDVFLHDRVTGTTTRVTPGTGLSEQAVISADGGTVALRSTAPDLVPGDAVDDGPRADVYAWTRATGAFRRVSWGDTEARGPTVSADGARIAFSEHRGAFTDRASRVVWSRATGRGRPLVGGEGGGSADVMEITDDGRWVLARPGDGVDAAIRRWELPA